MLFLSVGIDRNRSCIIMATDGSGLHVLVEEADYGKRWALLLSLALQSETFNFCIGEPVSVSQRKWCYIIFHILI